jgi:hypothetical protein
VCDTDISWDITVDGAPTTGSVSPKKPGCKALDPGDSARFKFIWSFGPDKVTPGATVVYTATVTVAGDSNAGNDTDSETRTVKGHGSDE